MRQQLEKFLRQQLFRTRENPLECFELRSAGLGNRGQEIDRFGAADITIDNFVQLLDDIVTRAQADADSNGNKMCRYTITALESGRKEGPRYSFRLRGEGEGDEGGEGDEEPTARGITQQLMRHNEAIMRMFLMSMTGNISSLTRRLDSVEGQNKSLIEQRQAYLTLQEQAASQQHERDIQLMLTSSSEDRKNELFKKLEMLLPIVLNKVAGQPLMPIKDQGVFNTLANSITPEQLAQIAPFFSQEQQMLLLTLIQAAREKK